jgi:hypothetical protein
MPDVIVPYQGGQVVLSEQSQAASKAAVEWAAADPSLAALVQGKSKSNQLDQVSAARLRQFEQEMRANPPKAAVIINLHPFPLSFGANSVLMRGITVPACPAGQQYAHVRIPRYRRDKEYEEDGTFKFMAIHPIRLAAEFVREFTNKDSYGGGVIIYEGDQGPEKLFDKEIETYDPIGRLITRDERGTEYDEENNAHPVMVPVPIKKKLSLLIDEQRQQRNATYLKRVNKANHDYKLPNGKGAWLIRDTDYLMAEVLYAEHQISALPEWNLKSRLDEGMAENGCPGCGADPRAGAFKCSACGHILSAFRAYEAGAIEYGHVSMETMSSDEWEEVEEIREQREKNRAQGMKQRQAGPKGKASRAAETEAAKKIKTPVITP